MPPWGETIRRQLRQLLELSPNWNSYSAHSVDPVLADAAWDLLSSLARDDTPAPAVIPTVRGGVQLEWHLRQIDLEIEFLVPQQCAILFEDMRAGECWEKELNVGAIELRDVLARLSAAAHP